jgi:hypothetical protein
MRILLVGNGAREHAIANIIKKSKHNPDLVVIGKSRNPGILKLSSEYVVGDIEDLDFIRSAATKLNPDYAIIGPDNQIGIGVADLLENLNIPTFAPLKTVARLESSKGFTRELVEKYNIPANIIIDLIFADMILNFPFTVGKATNDIPVSYSALKTKATEKHIPKTIIIFTKRELLNRFFQLSKYS